MTTPDPDPLPPEPPRDFSLRLGDIVRVMTASPSLELPLALIAPLPDEYAIRRGDLVRVPLQSWCGAFVEGWVRDVLWNGVVIVETAERARLKVRADECTILLTREAAEGN